MHTHLQLVKEQIPKDYDTVTKYLQFTTGRFESALQIKLNKAEAEKCGWVITIESEKKVILLCWASISCIVRIHLGNSNKFCCFPQRYLQKMSISSTIERWITWKLPVKLLKFTSRTPMHIHQDLYWKFLPDMQNSIALLS